MNSTPTQEPLPTAVVSESVSDILDLNYPDGTVVTPGTTISKTFQFRNSGDTVWSDYWFNRVYGIGGDVKLPTVKPGEVISVTIPITVAVANSYTQYEIVRPDGLRLRTTFYALFGNTMSVQELPPTMPISQTSQYCSKPEMVSSLPQILSRAQSYTETVKIQNCGSTPWTGVKLIGTYGKTGFYSPSVELPDTAPGESVSISIVTNIPSDWPFAFIHNIRELSIVKGGNTYTFGAPVVSFAIVQ